MTKSELYSLRTGDVIISELSGLTYVVTTNYGNRVTAVRSVDVTNPDEWLLSSKMPKRKSIKLDLEINGRTTAYLKTVDEAIAHANSILAKELEAKT